MNQRSFASAVSKPPLAFVPSVSVDDPLAAHWLRQVTLRLRREICWLWHERGMTTQGSEPVTLPPFMDRLADALDMARYDAEKLRFFQQDQTAAYLSELIDAQLPKTNGTKPADGSFSWVVQQLQLTAMDCFVLALALNHAVDSAGGTVMAACQNDPNRTAPTPALVQRLWGTANAVLPLLEPNHPLTLTGLLLHPTVDWDTPLQVAPLIARHLLYPTSMPNHALHTVATDATVATPVRDREVHLARLKSMDTQNLRLLPVLGPSAGAIARACADLSQASGSRLLQPATQAAPMGASQWMTLAWLQRQALLLPVKTVLASADDGASRWLPGLPLTVFIAVDKPAEIRQLPASITLPTVHVPPLNYESRLLCWQRQLSALDPASPLRAGLADCARRFRFEADAIGRICTTLLAMESPTAADLVRACRTDVELGELAQPVAPRFCREELMLPAKQSRQIDDLIQAVRSLTAVHYEWGTAQAWNEGGLSVLFSGPPGTGKTMAAEVIANAVDMPLYRIDLSQVVNKYIGETEKNLRTLFDAADMADVILFFDEADALFGKRTEVKDAHDRYANLEVSYLLERMERFKGIAILATNRKKDLDEAFLRRLRYLVDFPLPGAAERRRIWENTIPEAVDAAALDLAYLAERLPLSGGHIRSVVFNACLLSAHLGQGRVLTMPVLVHALKRELDKLGRTVSLDQFGPYACHVEE